MKNIIYIICILIYLISCEKQESVSIVKKPNSIKNTGVQIVSSIEKPSFIDDFGKDSIVFNFNGQKTNFLFFDYNKKYYNLTFYTSKYNNYWCKKSYIWLFIPSKQFTDTVYSLNTMFAYRTSKDCDVGEDIYAVDTTYNNLIQLHYDSTFKELKGYFDVRMVHDSRFPKDNPMNPDNVFFENCRFKLKIDL